MNPTRSRTPLRLKATIFALSLAAMATQVGGASAAPRAASARPAVQVIAASLPVVGGRDLLAPLANLPRHAPGSGSWALLIAGLTGVWAIGRRRVSAIGSRILDPQAQVAR